MKYFARLALATAFAAAWAAPGLAQTAQAVELDDDFVVQPWNVSVDAIEDMDVMGPGATKIGEVEEVLGSDAATPAALVVDFEDDSNYGSDDRVIPLDQLNFANNALTLATNPADVGKFEVYRD